MPNYVLGTDGVSVFELLVNVADSSLEIIPAPGATPSQTTVSNAISQKALNLIASSMRLIGVWASGEAPNMAEAADALMVFNQMIDAWNADRLGIFTTRSDDFPFVQGQQVYTLGPGGDFDMNRPAKIEAMSSIILSNPSNPVEIPIPVFTVEGWQTKVPVKVVNGSFPTLCYDDGGFPLRTLSFWPIPNEADAIRIYSWQPLGGAATLQSNVSFPFGYAEAFRYNLAVRLAPEFGATLRPEVAAIASDSLARVKSMNLPELELKSDLAVGNGAFNYRAEMFGLPY